jgi:hypothetical protein
MRAQRISRLAQLTIFTTAPVVPTKRSRLPIFRLLARHTKPHPRNSTPTGLRNLLPAVRAMRQPRPLRQPTLRAIDPVFNRSVDLILNGAVSRPSSSHKAPPAGLGEVKSQPNSQRNDADRRFQGAFARSPDICRKNERPRYSMPSSSRACNTAVAG